MFKKLGFLGKQVLLYSVLMLTVMLILTFFAQSYIMKLGRDNAVIYQEQLTTATVRQVDNYLEQLMLVATQVAHDSEIVSAMQMLHKEENDTAHNHFLENQAAQNEMVELLRNHNKLTNPFYRIDLFNLSGDYISTDPGPEILQAGVEFTHQEKIVDFLGRVFGEEEHRDLILLGPMPFFLPDDLKGLNYIYMQVPVKSYDGAEIYGYVNVYQSLDQLYSQLDMGERTATDVYLCYEINNGQMAASFYPPDAPLPETVPAGYHQTVQRSNYSIFIVLLQNQAEFLASYRSIRVYLLLGCFALFALLFICVYLLVRHTSKPILELNDRVREATLNAPFQPPVTTEALDEVKELVHSVDRMTQRLNASMELEKKAYLKALQAQMKPHFLYNCLATLSSMGVEAHSKDIPKFCTRLASILRYESTYDDHPATLADELENIHNYLELMQLRYEGDLTYILDADESLLSVPMPRLVLQPLVENCFDHGFDTAIPPWRVEIRIFRDNDLLCIEIKDNGCGFDEQALAELHEKVQSMLHDIDRNYANLQIGGLGIANTIVRLNLVTGNRFTWSVTKNEPTGTVITLKGAFHV